MQSLLTTGRAYCTGDGGNQPYARGPCSGLEFGPGPNPDHPVPIQKLIVMGFPLEDTGGQRTIAGEAARGRMFEPGNQTAAAHNLSTAGGPSFARFDVCPSPGVTKDKPGQQDDRKPDWPPRKDQLECFAVLPDVLRALPTPIVTEVRAEPRLHSLGRRSGVGTKRPLPFLHPPR